MKSFPLSLLCGLTAIAFLASPQSSEAALTIVISESGADVVGMASGTLNLAALTSLGAFSIAGATEGDTAYAIVGSPTAATSDIYSGVVGPTSFGAGPLTFVDAGTGAGVGVRGDVGYLIVPGSYISNAPVSATSTWTGETLATLGITPGTYTYNWGSGPTADSLTIQITAVPEPSSLAILAMGGLVLFARRRA